MFLQLIANSSYNKSSETPPQKQRHRHKVDYVKEPIELSECWERPCNKEIGEKT